MKNTLKIQDHGTMLTDYFQGTSGVWLNVSVDNKTTLKEVIDGLEEEINMVYDHIEFTAENHEFQGDLGKAIDAEIKTMREYIKGREAVIYNPDLDYCFDDLGDDDENDSCDFPVAIFTIEFTEEY